MSEKYEFIETMLTSFDKYIYPVTLMCLWLSISRSGFYDWRSRPTSAAAARRGELKLLIRHVFDGSDQTYGYRRVRADLGRSGKAKAGADQLDLVLRGADEVRCLHVAVQQPAPVDLTQGVGGEDAIARDAQRS